MSDKPTYEELRQRVAVLEAEAANRKDRHYARVIDGFPEVVLLTDLDGCIEDINGFGLQATGYERKEIVGRSMMDFIAPEDRESASRNHARIFQESLGPREYHLIFKGGGEVLHEINGGAVNDPEGRPVGAVFHLQGYQREGKNPQGLV